VNYSFFMKLVIELFELNNFQDSFALMSTQKLSNSKKRRTTYFNLNVKEDLNQKFSQISIIYQSRFESNGEYQQYLSTIKTEPCLPFFNLKNLELIDKEKDYKISNEIINWRKRCSQYEEIQKILSYQGFQYEFKWIPKLQEILEKEIK
jgi:hypothetical protein